MANNNEFIKNNDFEIGLFVLLLIHISGLFGIFSPYSEWFLQFTPLNLVISTILLSVTFRKQNPKLMLVFILTSIAGFTIEVVGVTTSWPFGAYSYGEVLGTKLNGVPLLIGINWGLLSFACALIGQKLFKKKYVAAAMGAILMVLLDFVIEPTAIRFGFWSWEAIAVPISNYIAWFVISYVLILLIYSAKVEITNPLLIPFFIIQFCFFGFLSFLTMEIALYISITIGTFLFMEFMAWFTHKFVMHGFLWYLHKDHHNPHKGFFEKNDAFFLIFAVPSAILFMIGSANGLDYRFFIGLGILLYGMAYFFVHDLFIHQRVKVLTRTNNPYLKALRKAHKVHHKHLGKEKGECFGMLWVPRKFFTQALEDQKNYN